MQPLKKPQVFGQLPPEWPDDPLPAIKRLLRQVNQKVVILDDDPTGTQTAHDVAVLTDWLLEVVQEEFAESESAVFVLTNSRSVPLEAAASMNREIGRRLVEASRATNRPFTVISRSDSTLRGHFPGETDALAASLAVEFDLTLLIPAFMAGGRYTIGDVHYVAENDDLVPAAQTPFARDSVFGYRASNLREWVAEKTAGRVRADEVASLSLDTIRAGGPDVVCESLLAMPASTHCVVNAVSERDLAVVALATLQAEAQGRHILYRTAASFASLRAGIDLRPVLHVDDLRLSSSNGGLVVVGSHVPKSTQQLHNLLVQTDIAGIEVAVPKLLDDAAQLDEIRRVTIETTHHLAAGQDVVIYSSRELVTGADSADNLAIGRRVSGSLVQIVKGIGVAPRYLVAKGGITSSDLATAALDARRAIVRGQILPGVPLWELGAGSRWPDLTYVVFPGNVGGDDALVELARKFRG